MGKYRKKPVVIEAVQWQVHGDHPAVRPPVFPGWHFCPHCSLSWTLHGEIATMEGNHIACPNDWIITGVKGEHYPCKPDIFEATYEPATRPDAPQQGEGNG